MIQYFHYIRNMEKRTVVEGLAALAHETRLDVFRMLVQAGPGGLPAGAMADKLGIPPQTLSFHLKELSRAGLVENRREGRSIIYQPDYDRIGGITGYLMENCCGG
jgi:DNA-binding transcriptional ArsR family regulator